MFCLDLLSFMTEVDGSIAFLFLEPFVVFGSFVMQRYQQKKHKKLPGEAYERVQPVGLISLSCNWVSQNKIKPNRYSVVVKENFR